MYEFLLKHGLIQIQTDTHGWGNVRITEIAQSPTRHTSYGIFSLWLTKLCSNVSHTNGAITLNSVIHNGKYTWWVNGEVADSRTWGIFIRESLHFSVNQWSIRPYSIESQWKTPYPVWKCVTYGSPQYPYCTVGFGAIIRHDLHKLSLPRILV